MATDAAVAHELNAEESHGIFSLAGNDAAALGRVRERRPLPEYVHHDVFPQWFDDENLAAQPPHIREPVVELGYAVAHAVLKKQHKRVMELAARLCDEYLRSKKAKAVAKNEELRAACFVASRFFQPSPLLALVVDTQEAAVVDAYLEALLQLGRFAEATQMARYLFKVKPREAWVQNLCGHVLRRTSHPLEAIDCYFKYLSLRSSDAYLWRDVAHCFLSLDSNLSATLPRSAVRSLPSLMFDEIFSEQRQRYVAHEQAADISDILFGDNDGETDKRDRDRIGFYLLGLFCLRRCAFYLKKTRLAEQSCFSGRYHTDAIEVEAELHANYLRCFPPWTPSSIAQWRQDIQTAVIGPKIDKLVCRPDFGPFSGISRDMLAWVKKKYNYGSDNSLAASAAAIEPNGDDDDEAFDPAGAARRSALDL